MYLAILGIGGIGADNGLLVLAACFGIIDGHVKNMAW